MRRPVVPIAAVLFRGAIAYFLIAKYDNEVVKCIYAVLITGIASAGAAGALKLRIALCRRKARASAASGKNLTVMRLFGGNFALMQEYPRVYRAQCFT